jgi:DNA-binding response OmpR family regulator
MSKTILIVEDEFLVALEMQCILEDEGYDVLGIAADLEGALAYTNRNIDLALVDLNLRDGLTGPEIGERLANEHDAAVLFVTANPRLLGKGISGTIGVITKPTDENVLLSAVRYGLRRKVGDSIEAPPFIRCFG